MKTVDPKKMDKGDLKELGTVLDVLAMVSDDLKDVSWVDNIETTREWLIITYNIAKRNIDLEL